MKVVSVVGARPEFVQAMSVSNALRARNHQEILVHTGQHFDHAMSQTFFDDLGLPIPDYNLEIGSGSHAVQTGAMLGPFETVLQKENPELVIVRGDTNSTLAGALVAAKLSVPLVHIEAGERSFDRRAPEEINRLIVDRISNLHLCASKTAIKHLASEGISNSVHWVGDVMLDSINKIEPIARDRSTLLRELNVEPGSYALVTLHRANNTDDPERLGSVVKALNDVEKKIIFPLHPRTKTALERGAFQFKSHVLAIPPVSYLDMISLESEANLILTDSGGVQREAYYLGIPCLTLREETEWVETIKAGWNQLVGVDATSILAAWQQIDIPLERPPIHGDGNAGQRVVEVLEAYCN